MPLRDDDNRRYQREWKARRRAEWIAAEGGRCAECGATEYLEVDHIDPSAKSLSPSHIWSRTETVREAELAKCQVLCRTCHKAKTRAAILVPHGAKGYGRGCRCDVCRLANTERARRTRAKKKN